MKIEYHISNKRQRMHSSFKHKSPHDLNRKSVLPTKNETIKQLASHKFVVLTAPHTLIQNRNLHLKWF